MFAASKTKSASTGGYQIQRSLRFNSADSAYLNRTLTTPTNNTTWSWSGWVKLGQLGTTRQLFGGAGANYGSFGFETTDQFRFWNNAGADAATSTAVYRDPSAWYHVVVISNGTTIKAYVNNSEVLSYTGTITNINSAIAHHIGRFGSLTYYYDGYMTEVNFIDGQALTPSSFGETNAQTGAWQPKAYSGSYGTNGFYLNFSDNSNTTAATLGKDYSGNGNNWTPNNFSVTAGAGNDSLVDSPTSYGTDTGVGGTVRGNYCTWNALAKGTNGSGLTLSNGNLDGLTPSNAILSVLGTIGVSSGKWYWEVTPTADGNIAMVGIGTPLANINSNAGDTGSQSWGYYGGSGDKFFNGTNTAYGATFTNNDVIGVALDMDAGTVAFYKNGASQGTAFTGLTGTILPMMGEGGTAATVAWNSNFGQRPFAYTAPSGFKALCTQNFSTPTIGATTATLANKFFNPVFWTGNSSNPRAITGVNFQPDLVWTFRRDVGYGNWLYDVIRGAAKPLKGNDTAAEGSYQQVNSFDTDGFTQAGVPDQGNNISGGQYLAWNWKAGGTGVSNTAGTITSTVSANTTSGFSVVTYTGNGVAGATIGHGMGIAPAMIIVKCLSTARDWGVWQTTLSNGTYLKLNTTDAVITNTSFPVFGDASGQTSTVVTLGKTGSSGPNGTTNASGDTYVAYCFAEVAGYSKFGSYTGNGSTDGPFLYLGFTPVLIWIKQSSAAGTNWRAITINTSYLSLNNTDAQYDSPPGPIRGMSNGVKIVGTGGDINGNGSTFIYAAFAANPFKYALAQSQ